MDEEAPRLAAGSDFVRERRRHALARIAPRLRSEPDDVSEKLPFEEVVAALGRPGETDLGVQRLALETIVGTVDRRSTAFDRAFQPVSAEVRVVERLLGGLRPPSSEDDTMVHQILKEMQ